MKEILFNVSPEEIRMALLEDGRLAEYEIERPLQSHLVGNIYKGRVQNVLPGMQAAFVDIKKKKNAFLFIGDDIPAEVLMPGSMSGASLHKGQSIMVQITKDAAGTKGPRATTHISLPGRNLVLMPTASYIGISHRIEDEQERERLRDIVGRNCPEGMGIIIRTAATGQSEEVLRADINYLKGLWETLKARQQLLDAPVLLYRDADLLIRVVRDTLTEEVDRLLIDDNACYQRILELARSTSPHLAERIKLYEAKEDIFAQYGLETAIAGLRDRQVSLPSGGFLVIDKTEALTVIDVNTGHFVGSDTLAETIYQTNLEAAAEILRQLRLRDIGGIIIVDFIDMDNPADKEALLEYMRGHVKNDRTKTNIIGITQLGLVEITRKKSRRNFDSIISSPCPCCDGTGRIESAETIAVKICRVLRRTEAEKHSANGYEILLHNNIAEFKLISEQVQQMANELGVKIILNRSQVLRQKLFQINMLM